MKSITPETLLDILIDFALDLRFEDLPADVVHEAKRRLLDAVGCAIGGLKDPAVKISEQVVSDNQTTAWDMAYLNTHRIRVLDWNDTYLSKEPAHPSDNIGALFAISHMQPVSGKELLTAMVVAYEIQCRLCDSASLLEEGWDHTYYVAVASSLACGKLLGLTNEEMKHAVALSMMRVPTRQGRAGTQLSMVKGTMAAEATREAVWSTIRASKGMTGPSEIVEGEFGLINQITGPLDLKAFEGLGEDFRLPHTYIKLYPVEYHAQAVVDVALRLREHIPSIEDITRIEIISYERARRIIGDADKRTPKTKESADHSIYFILAVSLLDGEMTLAQYDPIRYEDKEVLKLIDKMGDVEVTPQFNMSYRRHEFPVTIKVYTGNDPVVLGTMIPKGHPRNPLTDEELEEKFRMLCADSVPRRRQNAILKAIRELETKKNIRGLLE